MRIEPISPGVAYGVACMMRDRDREEFAAVSYTDDREKIAAQLQARHGNSGLLCAYDDENTPVCVGGCVPIRPGTASLLFYATDRFPRIGLPMTRFIKQRYFPALVEEGFHRIECVTLASYVEMHRWLEVLGLEREGLFRAYGKDRQDFIQYAWIAPKGGDARDP